MRKLFIFLFGLLFSVSHAQTYKNGTWYSLYDESEHTMNTQGDYETGNVFAPTNGKLNVQWRYEWLDWLGFAKKIATKVLESADNGSNTNEVGSLKENTSNNSNTTESFNISRNINWIKFSREGLPTHKVIVYHIDIPLAKHILLEDGTYGATSKSYNFGEIDALSTSEKYTVSLRSFLSAGDITISSSDPEIFHIGSADNTGSLVYAVGANACASANGTANTASGGTLGKIANYAFDLYFTPKEGKTYNGTITLTDGVSTATVNLSGKGRKLAQTITWEPETPVLSNATISGAVVSSGLEVAYAFDPEGVLSAENGDLTILSEGVVTVTASQAGNSVYEAAEPVVRTITIFPAVTRSEYSASFCQGDSVEFVGKWYKTAMVEDVLVPEKNIYGGDSIVTFTVVVLPTYLAYESATVNMDENITWREKEYGPFAPGFYTLYDSLKSQEECDSVFALELTVNAISYVMEEEGVACQYEQIEWHGQALPTEEAGTFVLYDSLQSIYGMDSVYALTLTVHPTYAIEDEVRDMYVGQAGEWHEIDLSLLPVGDTVLTRAYTTVSGCDSIYTMHLTVNEAPATYGVDTIYICGRGETAYYDNVPYTKPSKKPFTIMLSTPNHFGGDSIVELWVLASNKYDMTFSKTVDQGTAGEWQGIDLSVLPAGDTTLVVIYNTIHGCDSIYTLHLTVNVVQQEATALDNADAVSNKPYKFFRNGQMYIRKNGRVYNLQGIKVEDL